MEVSCPRACASRPGRSVNGPGVSNPVHPPMAGVQEACRLVRCHDSPVNSAFAGAAAGSLIHRANGELVYTRLLFHLAAMPLRAPSVWRWSLCPDPGPHPPSQ